MKKVVSGEELKNKIKSSINLLCDTVKITLGPKGRNVIIDNECLCPFITNDGVTIAENVESTDEVESAILKIAKETAIKTNEVVGDGTTTSLVLLQKIYNEGISSSENPIMLKKDMDESLLKIISKIDEYSYKASDRDLISIATISSADNQIGNIVGSAYNEVGKDGIINIEESLVPGLKLDLINGMKITKGVVAKYMLKNKEDELINPYILITNNKIIDMEEINNIINEIIETKRSLLIIAESYSEDVVSSLVLIKEQGLINVIAIEADEYVEKQLEILNDICAFTGGNLINKYRGDLVNNALISDLGQAKKIIVSEENTIIIDGKSNKDELNERKEKLVNELKEIESSYDKEYLTKRLSNLNSKSATITVGASTKTEMIEKKMRIEDAICSCKVAVSSGILPGGGLTLLKVSSNLENENNTIGMNILLKSLKSPFFQIIENVGLNGEEIYEELNKDNFNMGVDAKTLKYVDMIKSGIIDSKEVVINSLINAVSIATMLLTTDRLIINTGNIKSDTSSVY